MKDNEQTPVEDLVHRVKPKKFCSQCIHYMHHFHPFYHEEIIEMCASNPMICGDHVHKRLRYNNPREKNKDNNCPEQVLTFKYKILEFLKIKK